MRIRSVTIGTEVSYPLTGDLFDSLEVFQVDARARFARAGLEVQTVRLATQPFPAILSDQGPGEAVGLAQRLEELCRARGLDYVSIGPVVAARSRDDLSYIDVIPNVINQTENVFASVLVTDRERGGSLEAISKAAEAILKIAHDTPDGFGNLRLAILANCGPGSPFFPASYHGGPEPRFSIATEAADLCVSAFSGARSLEEARTRLCRVIEEKAQIIEGVCRSLENDFGLRFSGIDFSLAPFPEVKRSIGQAIEALGVEAFGGNGTLFAVALIKRVIEEAEFARCGFSGVMLPVLEDATLARRSFENLFSLDSLLLYSTVCGTGLDTIPFPGHVTVKELSAVLLDIATLSLVADKPLTARLMPIPGKRVGERTDFDFPYFANARIVDVRNRGASRIFDQNADFSL